MHVLSVFLASVTLQPNCCMNVLKVCIILRDELMFSAPLNFLVGLFSLRLLSHPL